MSITVNLYYTGENGNARKFAEEMEQKGVADRIRAEEGNLRYEYFLPLKQPETVQAGNILKRTRVSDTLYSDVRRLS